ncbi:MAG: hypothetical protein WCB04_00770 [Mycobacteriales bacterium]
MTANGDPSNTDSGQPGADHETQGDREPASDPAPTLRLQPIEVEEEPTPDGDDE